MTPLSVLTLVIVLALDAAGELIADWLRARTLGILRALCRWVGESVEVGWCSRTRSEVRGSEGEGEKGQTCANGFQVGLPVGGDKAPQLTAK